MTSMTRRALARSATISAGAAIAVPLKTPLARSCTATLQHTRLGAVAYGRICPVHIWPVLRCPPRLPNSATFVAAFYGALRAGAVVAPLSPRYRSQELEYYLRDLDPAA
ncbi:MAG: long-chain fatty acid--CoA ligase, partial [Actinobacteria bacterium]